MRGGSRRCMVFLRALERPSSTGEGQPAIPNNNTPGQERVMSAGGLTPMNPLIRKKGAISLWRSGAIRESTAANAPPEFCLIRDHDWADPACVWRGEVHRTKELRLHPCIQWMRSSCSCHADEPAKIEEWVLGRSLYDEVPVHLLWVDVAAEVVGTWIGWSREGVGGRIRAGYGLA